MTRSRLRIFPNADAEVNALAELVEVERGTVLAPREYSALFRTWNISHGADLFAVPIAVQNSAAGQIVLGAFKLAENKFSRQSLWNYLAAAPICSQGRPIELGSVRRTYRDSGILPESVQDLLAKVVSLTSSTVSNMAQCVEETEQYLRSVLPSSDLLNPADQVAVDAIFETIYRLGELNEEIGMVSFSEKLREELKREIAGVGQIPVTFVPTAGEVHVVGSYEDSDHLSEFSIANVGWLSVPLLHPTSRRPTYVHPAVVRQFDSGGQSSQTSELAARHAEFVEINLANWWPEVEGELIDRFAAVKQARASDQLTQFDGNVGEDFGLAIPKPTYVSFLESFAGCAFQTFLDRELGLQPDEDDPDALGIAPVDRGSLVHEILHRFFASVPPRESPSDPWSAEERGHFVAVLNEVFDSYLETNGQNAFVAAERASVQLALAGFLDEDEKFRAENGVIPAHQEIWFGGIRDQIPAVMFRDADLQISLRGRVDRIDQSLDGDTIVITDYKTGNSAYAPSYKDGPLEEGDLQLPVYAEAVRSGANDAKIYAQQWFVTDSAQKKSGFQYDERVRSDLSAALLDLASDYSAGRFAAHPGDELPWGYSNCQHCPYDRICPVDRGEAYIRKNESE